MQRGEQVAGIDAELARSMVRACFPSAHGKEVAGRLHMEVPDIWPLLEALESAGYITRKVYGSGGEPGTEWSLTIAGNALRMASFGRPIARETADRLLAGVIERVREYNADDSKPYVVDELTVFGSYLDTEVVRLGDLDIAVKFSARREGSDSSEALLVYADRSGRSFSTFVDQLDWATKEMFAALRQRSAYVNIHRDDPRQLTDRWKVVYP